MRCSQWFLKLFPSGTKQTLCLNRATLWKKEKGSTSMNRTLASQPSLPKRDVLSLVHTWLPDRIGFAKKASSSRTTWQTVGQQDLKIPSSYHILSRCCHLFQTLVWQTVRVPEAPGNFKVVTGQSQLFANCEIGTHFLVSIFFMWGQPCSSSGSSLQPCSP